VAPAERRRGTPIVHASLSGSRSRLLVAFVAFEAALLTIVNRMFKAVQPINKRRDVVMTRAPG
jgi:hypothetical protein